jgi:putative acetyltransferase
MSIDQRIAIRPIANGHEPNSPVIIQLAHVFRSARRARLQFLIDLHSIEEDRHFLSQTVLPANQVWVADLDEKIVGFIAFADGWVNHLYIAPEYQRQGVGRRLLEIAKSSSTVLDLWVFEANVPAILFYEREGFRIIQRTDGAANEAKMPDVQMQWTRSA